MRTRHSLIPAAVLAFLATAAAADGLDLAAMDRTVRPGDDFFAYANGSWIKNTEIPADRPSYGNGAILSEQVDKEVADLIQETAKNAKTGESQKIADYYNSFMDEAGIEAKGIKPLEAGLARIAAIKDKKALAAALGGTLQADIDALNSTNFFTDNLFGLWVAADLDHPDRYAPFLFQGGLSLPDRAYYVTDSERMAGIRTRYQAHIGKILTLAGIKDAEAKAAKIYAIEMAIAKAHWDRAESEDVLKADNRWSRETFARQAPGLDWDAYFKAAHLGAAKEFIVWQPSAIVGEAALVGSTPLVDWKDYLTYHYIDRNSWLLPKDFVDERFDFYGKTLNGTPVNRARWKRGVAAVNEALGMAVGKLYVAQYFPPEDKAAVQDMVKNLVAAFKKRIDALAWMSPETKTKAQAKLATLKVGVGYPDRWIGYEDLKVAMGDAFGNAQRAEAFDTRRKLGWLGKPVDRDEWVMNPQLVNAVNLPVLNALNFPAAILRAPYFSLKHSAAQNYGSTGAVIGHEISHSFDSAGALFDSTGKLQNWWTDEDLAHFHAAAQVLEKQFDGYKPFPDAAVNGKQTLDENIADVAGLAAALDAYHLSLNGQPAPAADGFGGDQQFFIGFAQSWQTKFREPLLRRLLITDGHAPDQYRAQTVRNIADWYGAFDVKPGESLYLAPDQRVKIW